MCSETLPMTKQMPCKLAETDNTMHYPHKAHREVPTYEIHSLTNKASRYCVCVFVINEGQKLRKQLKRMALLADRIDIVIADGGSTDGSTNISELGSWGVNTLLVKTGVGRLGAQMRMAFDWAIERQYEGVVVIDGNNKDSVEDIPEFTLKLDNGYDHIQGSRFISGGYHKNTPLSRLIGLKIIHAPLIRLSSGFHYTDTTNGFRAYSVRLLQDPRISIFRDIFSGYELHYYLAVRAPRLGYRCTEVPVSRIYPPTGKIPTKISPIKGNFSVIRKLLATCLRKYDPPR